MTVGNDLRKNVSRRPFRYLKLSVITESYVVLGALLLHVLMLAAEKSASALLVVLACAAAACLAEAAHSRLRRRGFFPWAIALIHGVLVGLLLPETYPPLAAFFIVLCVLLVNTFLLGGFADSWMNPVCVAVVVCWVLGMRFFPPPVMSAEEARAGRSALALIQDGTFPVSAADPKITGFLNRKVLGVFGASVPDGYVSLLWDSHSPIPAFRFNFLALASALALFACGVFGFVVPAVFLFCYGLLVKSVAPLIWGGPPFSGDLALAFLTGGMLFCALFVLQWPGTVPLSGRGKVIYGASAGVLAFFLAGAGMSPVGAAFTMLSMNIVSLLIQAAEDGRHAAYEASVLRPRAEAVEEGVDA